jgi:hypothetical protein
MSDRACPDGWGAVAELVGNKVGVVSGVINLESSGVEALLRLSVLGIIWSLVDRNMTSSCIGKMQSISE